MKSRVAFGLIILSILAAPIGVHAQLRGLLKKKADEVLKGKPAPAEPAAPAAPAPSSPSAPSLPAGTPSARADAKPQADPLDSDGLDLKMAADRTLRGDGLFPERGDWDQLPYIARKTITAAKALDEPARVAFVERWARPSRPSSCPRASRRRTPSPSSSNTRRSTTASRGW